MLIPIKYYLFLIFSKENYNLLQRIFSGFSFKYMGNYAIISWCNLLYTKGEMYEEHK